MSAPPVSCPSLGETLRLVRLRGEDVAGRAETARLDAHLAACSACREEALSRDPSLIFRPLAEAIPIPATSADGRRMALEVRAALELDRTRRRVFPRRPPAAFLRAAAVLALGAGLLAAVLSNRSPAPEVPRVVAAAAPAAAGLPGSAGSPTVPAIEGVASPEAQVYQFAATTTREATVIFVVDRNADL